MWGSERFGARWQAVTGRLDVIDDGPSDGTVVVMSVINKQDAGRRSIVTFGRTSPQADPIVPNAVILA